MSKISYKEWIATSRITFTMPDGNGNVENGLEIVAKKADFQTLVGLNMAGVPTTLALREEFQKKIENNGKLDTNDIARVHKAERDTLTELVKNTLISPLDLLADIGLLNMEQLNAYADAVLPLQKEFAGTVKSTN